MNYQLLFDYMSKQHGVDLIETDMIEIVRIVNEIQKSDEPQPKTIREWFGELPEPYRSEALKFALPSSDGLPLMFIISSGIGCATPCWSALVRHGAMSCIGSVALPPFSGLRPIQLPGMPYAGCNATGTFPPPVPHLLVTVVQVSPSSRTRLSCPCIS